MTPTAHCLACCALWLALAGCSRGPDLPPAAQPDAGSPRGALAARLEAATGGVKLERGGKLSPAQLGELFVGDAIETAEAAEARVRFPGGRLVEVGPETRFTLTEGEGGLVLNVARGLVLTRVPSEPPARAGLRPEPHLSLSILTAFGLTRVGKSEVAIHVGEEAASVEVKIGMVELVSRSGEVTQASAGDRIALGKTKNPGPIVLPTVVVGIAATGKSELKKKGAKSWVAVGKKTRALEAGDQLRVKDGRTVLAPEGSGTRLVFGRGTELEFLGATRGEGLEVTELELKKGELSGSLPLKQKSRVKLNGGLTLVSDLGGQFALTKTASGLELAALAGDFRLEREGAPPALVKGGQSAKVGPRELSVSDPSREQMVLPSKMGLKVYHPGLGRLSLGWEGEEGKPYRVEVAANPGFIDPLLAGVVHQRFVSVPAPPRGNLYWRVFEGDKEIDRGSAYFAPEPRAGGELDLRRNEVHDGADKTTIYYQDKPPAVTFTFAIDPRAAKHKVAIFQEGALGTPLVERLVTQGQVVLDGALAEGKYLWSVTPLDASGAGLKGGKMNKLEIAYDNAVPNLIIKAPRNGDPGGSPVAVVGIAPVGAKVFINGKAVELDDKARFETKATPLPGGRLVFRMVGRGGAEVFTVRTVRR